VATKIDKLKAAERASRIEALSREAGVDGDQIIPFSAVSREGRDELAAAIVQLIGAPREARSAEDE
jgi:GTP-binding protein EngB required for normal cell division